MRAVPQGVGGVSLLLGIWKFSWIIPVVPSVHFMVFKHFSQRVGCTATLYLKLELSRHFRHGFVGNIVLETKV